MTPNIYNSLSFISILYKLVKIYISDLDTFSEVIFHNDESISFFSHKAQEEGNRLEEERCGVGWSVESFFDEYEQFVQGENIVIYQKVAILMFSRRLDECWQKEHDCDYALLVEHVVYIAASSLIDTVVALFFIEFVVF